MILQSTAQAKEQFLKTSYTQHTTVQTTQRINNIAMENYLKQQQWFQNFRKHFS